MDPETNRQWDPQNEPQKMILLYFEKDRTVARGQLYGSGHLGHLSGTCLSKDGADEMIDFLLALTFYQSLVLSTK